MVVMAPSCLGVVGRISHWFWILEEEFVLSMMNFRLVRAILVQCFVNEGESGAIRK